MNIKRILELSFHSMRFLLLLITLFALTVMSVWIVNPSIIRKIDTNIISNYIKYYELQLQEADRLITIGENEDAIKALKSLVEELKNIKKQDRLDSIKLKVLQKLVQIYIKMNDVNQALEWVETWISFDDRDLIAQVELSKLLSRIPGRETDGMKIIADLYEKVPNSHPVVDTYINLLLDNGKNTEAALVGYRRTKFVENQLRSMEWEVFWDTGNNFNAKQRKRLNPIWQNSRGDLILSSTIPGGKLKQFRIDSPGWMNLRIEDSVISFDDGLNQSSLLIKNVLTRYNDIIRLRDGVLVAHGKDPYFHFNVPEGIGINGEVKIVFRAKVSIGIPERLNTLLSKSKVRKQIVADLNEIYRNDVADYIVNLPLN